MCAYSPGGPFSALLLAPPLTFSTQTQCWLLAASHYLSLKARSDRLACFVLLSLLYGFSTFFCLCFLDAKKSPETPGCFFFCISPGNRLIYSSIDFCLFFSQSNFLLLGLLNMRPVEASLIRCCTYLGCFSGSQGSCANLQALTHRDRNKTPMPHLER